MLPQPHTTIGRYLARRLEQLDLGHIFSIPGDYILGFFDILEESGITVVGSCNELNAAYAADGYARQRGVGALCVTYAVGGLSAVNGVAGAMAERVPLVVISGGPMLRVRKPGYLLHHTLVDFDLVRRVYDQFCLASIILDDPATGPEMIDRTLKTCLEKRGPVYIELPVDMVDEPCSDPGGWDFRPSRETDPEALEKAVAAAREILTEETVLWLGQEVRDFGALAEARRLVDSGLPFMTSRQSKGLLPETNPHFGGVYRGRWSRPETLELAETGAPLLNLGVWPTNINTGGYSAKIDPAKTVQACFGQVKVGDEVFEPVSLKEFAGAMKEHLTGAGRASLGQSSPPVEFTPDPEAKLTSDRLLQALEAFFDENTLFIADIGGPMIGATDTRIPEGAEFLTQGFYLSIGYSVPAGLGAALANPNKRPLILVGDGAFQMTCQEISIMVRQGIKPIIVVLNNDGYQIERAIHDGPFNDIQPWNYSRITDLVGGGQGFVAETEGRFQEALDKAAELDQLAVIDARVDRYDYPKTMRMMFDNKGKAH